MVGSIVEVEYRYALGTIIVILNKPVNNYCKM